MAALITDYLQKLPSAERPRNWVIAHSGGLDSQVLLHLAARYFDTSELRVVHVNHHLQADAEQWAEFSQAQAAALGLRFSGWMCIRKVIQKRPQGMHVIRRLRKICSRGVFAAGPSCR